MYYIRWATTSDIIKIADLEDTVYLGNGYDKNDISKIKTGKNNIIMVADDGVDGILGYCIYNLSKKKIYVIRIVVDPEHQSHGIGRAFIQKLKERIENRKIRQKKETCNVIEFELEDDNIVGHLFLKSHGFQATKVLWGDKDEDDLYVFQYDGSVPAKLP